MYRKYTRLWSAGNVQGVYAENTRVLDDITRHRMKIGRYSDENEMMRARIDQCVITESLFIIMEKARLNIICYEAIVCVFH